MFLKKQSLSFNFVLNFLLSLSSLLFPLITFPYVSRILEAEGMGRIAFVTGVVSYFTILGMFGIQEYGIRECAKVRENKALLTKKVKEIFFFNLFTMAFSLAFFLLAVFFVPRLAEEKELFILYLLMPLLTVLSVEWLYKALEQYPYIAVRSLLFKCLALVLMFVLVKKKEDLMLYAGLTLLASVGSFVLNFFHIRTFLDFSFKESVHPFSHWKACLPFFFLSLATVVYTNVDLVLLGFWHNAEVVGYYQAALKVKSVLVILLTSLGAVLLPRLSYYIEMKEYAKFWQLAEKSFRFVWFAGLPLSLYFTFYAQASILFLSGESFLPAVLPMQILMPTLLCIGFSNLLGLQVMVPLGKEKALVHSVLAGALVSFTLNMLWLKEGGVLVAALSNLLAESVVLLYQIFSLRKELAFLKEKKDILKIFAGSFASLVLLIFVEHHFFAGLAVSLLLKFLLSASFYFGLYFLFLFLLKEKFLKGK